MLSLRATRHDEFRTQTFQPEKFPGANVTEYVVVALILDRAQPTARLQAMLEPGAREFGFFLKPSESSEASCGVCCAAGDTTFGIQDRAVYNFDVDARWATDRGKWPTWILTQCPVVQVADGCGGVQCSLDDENPYAIQIFHLLGFAPGTTGQSQLEFARQLCA